MDNLFEAADLGDVLAHPRISNIYTNRNIKVFSNLSK